MNTKKVISIVSLFALTIGSMFGLEVSSPFYHCGINHSGILIKLKNSAKGTQLHFSDSAECYRIPCNTRIATLESGESLTLPTAKNLCNNLQYRYNFGSCPNGAPVDVVIPDEPSGYPDYSHNEHWGVKISDMMKSSPVERVVTQVIGNSTYNFHVKESYDHDFKTLVVEIEMTDVTSSDEL